MLGIIISIVLVYIVFSCYTFIEFLCENKKLTPFGKVFTAPGAVIIGGFILIPIFSLAKFVELLSELIFKENNGRKLNTTERNREGTK